jgi:hypothetical membrane protein
MKYSYERIAGTILLVGLAQFILLLQVAEDLYPNYSTSQNYISDLGATCRPTLTNCSIIMPSSFIFNGSTTVLGILVAISAFFLQRAFNRKLFSLFMLLAGIGIIGVGLFPETTGIVHLVAAFIGFVFMGLAALMSSRIVQPPQSYASIILGILTLVDLILFTSGNYVGLGVGGMERMIVYPAAVWGLAFAGFLIHQFNETKA